MTAHDEFSVDPTEIRAFADNLSNLADSASGGPCGGSGPADTYARMHVVMDGWADPLSVYRSAVTSSETIRDDICDMFSRQAECFRAGHAELISTADLYEQTDIAAAVELDRTYPGTGTAGSLGSAPLYTVLASPTQHLTEPADAETPQSILDEIFGTDWLSATQAISQLVDWIFDVDLLEKAAKCFSGDWQDAQHCRSAIRSLADFERSTADAISFRGGQCFETWQGVAATSCSSYFESVTTQIRTNADSLDTVAQKYVELHDGIIENANIVKGLISQLVDHLIIVGVLYAAGTITAESGVGAILGYGLGSVVLIRVIQLYRLAKDAIDTSINVASGLVAAIGATTGLSMGVADLPIPAGYDNPQVR